MNDLLEYWLENPRLSHVWKLDREANSAAVNEFIAGFIEGD
jgi:hypothetical protein